MMFVVCPATFFIVNASSCEKSCLHFLIPATVLHMLLLRIFAGIHMGERGKPKEIT